MASEARIAANRLNAQKSTGPRTEEGKNRSSQNATKHGLCAGRVVLPDEDAEEYQALIDEWLEAYGGDPASRALAERAAAAQWKLRRCDRAEAGYIRDNHLRNQQLLEDNLREHARALGEKLIDPYDVEYFPRNPDPLIATRAALETTATGLAWRLEKLEEIVQACERGGSVHQCFVVRFGRLMGVHPGRAHEDPVLSVALAECIRVAEAPNLIRQYMRSDGVKIDEIIPPGQQPLGPDGESLRKEFYRSFLALTRKEVEKARADLERVEHVEKAVLEVASPRGSYDASVQIDCLNRYQRATELILQGAINGLLKLKREAQSEPRGAEPPAPAPPPAPLRNEPNVPAPAPASGPSGPSRSSPQYGTPPRSGDATTIGWWTGVQVDRDNFLGLP